MAATSATQHVPFTATWNPENCHLQSSFSDIVTSPHLHPCEKVTRCITQALENCREYYVPKQYIIGGLRETPEEVGRANQGWFERWEGPSCSSEQALLRDAYEPM